MLTNHCYWSLARGASARLFAQAIQSARAVGVFNDICLFTDQVVEGAICYQTCDVPTEGDMDVLFYLKEGLVKSRYDYYIYMAPGTQFRRKPRDPLEVLGESPLHVTLETKISGREEGRVWLGHPVALYYQRLREAGVQNPIYLSTAAFWIVHHEAIPTVFGLAYHFWALGKKAAPAYGLDAALSYVMQMLCGDPGEHTIGKTSALWAPIRGELGEAVVAPDQHWKYAYPLSEDKTDVNPCLISRIN